ncbi:hypothetical protein K440DRAFT_680842 [Wilcoxina mikolae CBS 423.85]|nr:hypothetical protein K440DRAFT_680842 [Wilcoxina mikolae CBS 423.85]
MAGRDNPSPAPSLTPSKSSTNKSLSRTLSSASSTYNTKFLSAFKPPTKKPSLEPILIPGLDGILSNSGVAKVFDLDPRKQKQKGLTRVLKKISGYKKDEDEDKDKGRLKVRVRARGDKLPKHSNVFTGMPTPDASAINSVYPSSTSGETSAEEGEDQEDMNTATTTATLSTPIPMPDTPTPGCPRRKRRKSVSFSLSGDHGGLARMPSVHEPCPEVWPGATPEEVERYEHARRHEESFLGCGRRRPWRKRMDHHRHRRHHQLGKKRRRRGRESGGIERKRLRIPSECLGS